MSDLAPPPMLDETWPLYHPSPTAALQALSVQDAMELARVVLAEICTTGGKYGLLIGDIVYDSARAEYALRKAMEKLGKPS